MDIKIDASFDVRPAGDPEAEQQALEICFREHRKFVAHLVDVLEQEGFGDIRIPGYDEDTD
jgi:hypothetical protein